MDSGASTCAIGGSLYVVCGLGTFSMGMTSLIISAGLALEAGAVSLSTGDGCVSCVSSTTVSVTVSITFGSDAMTSVTSCKITDWVSIGVGVICAIFSRVDTIAGATFRSGISLITKSSFAASGSVKVWVGSFFAGVVTSLTGDCLASFVVTAFSDWSMVLEDS